MKEFVKEDIKKIEENKVIKEKTIESMFEVKDYDAETRAFIDKVFRMVTSHCIVHCEEGLGIELDDEIDVALYNSEEYMAKCKSLFGENGSSQLYTFGQFYFKDAERIVMIHGYEGSYGMMNWMSDFKQFEKLTNTIMELAASDRHMQYCIRDKDFSKKLFEEVQERVQKRNAA